MVDKVPKKIGIMGGTFDPIHYGHLVAAEAARHQLKLEQVIFVPSGQPPHKQNCFVSPPETRLAMTQLAIADNQNFTISRVELERQGPSYTIDTVSYFSQVYSDAAIYFITGADAILELLTWKDAFRLLDSCYFIAVTRPGYDLGGLEELRSKLPKGLTDKIIPLEVPGIAISSTGLRQRVQRGEPIQYLVPDPVRQYIVDVNLYK